MDQSVNFFLKNWERKSISLFLAILIWFVVNKSLTTLKTFDNVSVRLTNIPTGMTVKGLQSNGILCKKISMSLQGNQKELSKLTSNDFEVVLNAMDKTDKWQASISHKNLISLNPDIDLTKTIKRITTPKIPIRFARLITQQVLVTVTKPIGQAPHGYQYLDIWPYSLRLTVSGPEDTIQKLKTTGLSITFNLNNISLADLESQENESDEVSFLVPNAWKQLSIPEISESPIEIDDPQAKYLSINFVKNNLYPLSCPIPVSLFFPPNRLSTINPTTHSLAASKPVELFNGLFMIKQPLYAKGTGRLFIDLIQNMLEISIVVAPKPEKPLLDLSLQLQDAKNLEDRFVSISLSEEEHIRGTIHSKIREEYLRNRFRTYINRLQLYKTTKEKFNLQAEIQEDKIFVKELE
jgi:YbbR domain-containing protein